MDKAYYKSPVGNIEIVASSTAITAVQFVEQQGENSSADNFWLQQCITQLEEYFTHKRNQFQLQLAPAGTAFQLRVWEELREIPYGKTMSYMELARKLGNEKAIRAVGRANSKNPIAIIIPCHRVIGSNGKLVGYAGGLWRKQWLLQHEKALLV